MSASDLGPHMGPDIDICISAVHMMRHNDFEAKGKGKLTRGLGSPFQRVFSYCSYDPLGLIVRVRSRNSMDTHAMNKLDTALAAIDAANTNDPDQGEGQPAALLYGHRMSTELDRLFPDASDPLKIAAHGQHIERWMLKRVDFPEGREGYLTWRSDLAQHHATRVGEIMMQAGYSGEEAAAAGQMIRKEGIKRNADVQALEDVICFVFLKWYFAPFSDKHSAEKLERIVARTARKMSAEGRARALKEFELPDDLVAAFQD